MYYPNNTFIILKGSTPPPIGGVSIHINRLTNVLEKKGTQYYIWDTSNGSMSYYSSLLKVMVTKFPKDTILHLHSTYWKHLLFVYIISFIKPFKIYLTNHNIWSIDKKYKWTGKLLAMIQSRLVKLLYVNENTPERYKAAGIKMCENSEKISPFLPPNIEDGKNIFEEYSFEIKSFVENKSPLLIANAHKIVFLEDTDLYGFDMCLASLEVLVSKYPNLGLIFAIGNVDEHSNYIQEKIERLKSKNLDDSFLLVFPQITIWPLIDEVDILLRPTCTDGSAISIDEALYLGTKVIASDVTSRQEGSILFKSRDQNDFENCILKVLNNAPSTN